MQIPSHRYCIVSTHHNGGAGNAARRVHRALLAQGEDSSMRVNNKQSDDWRIIGHANKLAKARAWINTSLSASLLKLQRSRNPVLHSLCMLPTGIGKELNNSSYDLVNLHWFGHDMISVAEIARIHKPLVFTLHDSWAFCGTEHLPDGLEDMRYKEGYARHNRPSSNTGLDLDRFVWRAKKKYWTQKRHIICPSNWMAECVNQSSLMKDWPVTVIPNALDTDLYKPIEKKVARHILGLPTDKKILLFGAIGGQKDFRKGFDLLAGALQRLSTNPIMEETQCIVAGQSAPQHQQLNVDIRYMGHMYDDYSMALLYNAVDITVVPSRVESFGQAASEALACGTPVVAFNTTGLKDIVDEKTGYLAESYSASDLANGIISLLENENIRLEKGAAGRKKALELWASPVIAQKYLQVYQEALGQDP